MSESTANLTAAECAARAADLRLLTQRVELDLTHAADHDGTTFPVTSVLELESSTTETWVDFRGASVHEVIVNDTPLDAAASFDGSRVRIAGLDAGDGRARGRNTVVIRGEGTYGRTGQGLHRFRDPVDGETYLYTHYEPADARRVFPCLEQPDLKTRWTFVVTAPEGWVVRSNRPAASSEPADRDGTRVTTHTFEPTELLSSYITAVCAGPYAVTERTWRGDTVGGPLEIPVSAMCRQSIARHFDPETVLDITCAGLTYFHEVFEYPYPWGKYDQVFVPEYNLGAMENPGLVTFTEHYIFESAPTRKMLAARANTILHEMAHMWFGDLVTMRWWGDLWLKESFAEYMGTQASVHATEFTDAWTSFASRKNWAYREDQLSTTHPIVADIADLEAARQNFDGITYAKGASVLKALAAYVTEDAFFEGSRQYFRDHAFGNTTLDDLLAAMEAASGRSMADWTAPWLETTGPSTIRAEVGTAPDGTIASLRLTQDNVEPDRADSEARPTVVRPHRLALGLYDLVDGRLQRTERLEVDLLEATAEVPEAVGLRAPDLLLVNDDDLTFAKVRLDERSLATVEAHLSTLTEPLSRSVVWTALWDMTRDAELSPVRFARTVVEHTDADPTYADLTSGVTQWMGVAVEDFLPLEEREAWRHTWADHARAQLEASPAGSDAQLVWAAAWAAAAARDPQQADAVRAVLDGSTVIEGLPLDPARRWAFQRALAAVGRATVADLEAELERERSASTVTELVAARASLPGEDVKAEAFRTLLTPGSLVNDHVDATIRGFRQPLHDEVTAAYRDRYFEQLETIWREHPMEIAERLVAGLFPGSHLAPGAAVGTDPVLQQATAWLEEHPDAPTALVREVRSARDALRWALEAQAAGRV